MTGEPLYWSDWFMDLLGRGEEEARGETEGRMVYEDLYPGGWCVSPDLEVMGYFSSFHNFIPEYTEFIHPMSVRKTKVGFECEFITCLNCCWIDKTALFTDTIC